MRVLVVLVLFVFGGTVACGDCTDMACISGFSVRVSKAQGPIDASSVHLAFGDRDVTCDLDPTGDGSASCSDRTVEAVQVCSGIGCAQGNDIFIEVVGAVPDEVFVELRGGADAEGRMFPLAFEDFELEDTCGEGCRRADLVMSVDE
jgi:hypothetical protein